MKERPILFSGPMVRAILKGLKTQTRRVIKLQPDTMHDGEPYWHVGGYRAWRFRDCDDVLRRGGNDLKCPYGEPGDRIWVRETTCIAPKRFAVPDDTCLTDYDGDKRYVSYKADGHSEDAMRDYKLNWTPSIRVPRWASRIDLEITGIRAERLQDITAKDAISEGTTIDVNYDSDASIAKYGKKPYPVRAFALLWESINGVGSWDANPWVWVVEFRRIKL